VQIADQQGRYAVGRFHNEDFSANARAPSLS
jgi:hypothetical protein